MAYVFLWGKAGGDCENAALVDFPRRPDLEGKKPDLADAVAVIPEIGRAHV